ncbi:TetR/AcrR family transcriptional regulator [Amycolatopsis magusensis]|uniref:AcrR family transcriptional regulator n=1 Tax=Amycolatopsis magusensis TaxID=882444 RepID=A0ABS4PSZ0_9PSEU|nr:TetR/AcrR family transcriptional regulator [Amycolatopsis magusensis]MBP2182552.1 AcrR family transcriptional regulator [Amycolatopsis magusensis]MDI5980521.1 TetR/AcrR family transcriptional regulator [Amycolatopsis magusensis]
MAGQRPPRERMVYSAAQLVRARGVAGTGVRDVVEHAGAPRGSFQHYFPGGKDQLVGEALLWSAEFAASHAAAYSARKPTPAGLFAHLVKQWKDEFTRRGFERGCPVMATAADLAGSDSAVTGQLRVALERWEQAVADQLTRMDLPARRARRLATLMISTLEGAIMAARIRQDVTPLTTVVTELSPLFDQPGAQAPS